MTIIVALTAFFVLSKPKKLFDKDANFNISNTIKNIYAVV